VVTLSRTIPALPVRSVDAALGFYRERLGFEPVHRERGFAIVGRDDAVVHLWEAGDESWQGRELGTRPVQSGAESFIAGTASCRIQVEGVDDLYGELGAANVLHAVSRSGVDDTEWGTREFATLDGDGNLITFFERMHA
jgi:catechol 2,3-dioxygenase-like lactoylglutathione lyase family enzyme